MHTQLQILGHRGAKGEAPENTLAGFRHARDLGLTAIELDVRLTRDDQVVIMHDATVDRTTNGTGAVSDLTLAEITALDARASFPDWPEPCAVPTLAEVLDEMRDLALIQIEFKSDTPERLERLARHVIAEIAPRAIAGQVAFSSFDPVALEIVRREAPEIPRAYIGAWDTEDFFTTAHRLGCVQADINFRSGSAGIVQRAHDEGLTVVGWPCDPDRAGQALAWGVDAVTTDYPTALRERLGALSPAP
jgi:glycerophosphoryl diester phosphodiesterase